MEALGPGWMCLGARCAGQEQPPSFKACLHLLHLGTTRLLLLSSSSLPWLLPSPQSFASTDQGCALQVDPLIFPWHHPWSKHASQGGTNRTGAAVWSSSQPHPSGADFHGVREGWEQSFCRGSGVGVGQVTVLFFQAHSPGEAPTEKLSPC